MTDEPVLQLRTFENRTLALGLAVEYLMNKPAFARLPFGHWSRVLTGQIRRGHYVFVVGGKRVVGFAGWAAMSEAEAEAWVTGVPGATDVSGTSGDCAVMNAWAADSPGVNEMLFGVALDRAKAFRMLYAKREYANGGSRPLRLRMKDSIAANLAKATGVSETGT